MYFIYRDGGYLDATGLSFRDWMEGKCPLLPGEYPTLDDWEQHLTTVFPEVRLSRSHVYRFGCDNSLTSKGSRVPRHANRACLWPS